MNLACDPHCSELWTNNVAPRLHLLFEDLIGEEEREIRPSLLHGDLWSGNIGSADGRPSIFDPAAYWGHHEAEWGVSFFFLIPNSISLYSARMRLIFLFDFRIYCMYLSHLISPPLPLLIFFIFPPKDVLVRGIRTSVLGGLPIAHPPRRGIPRPKTIVRCLSSGEI